MKNPKCWARKLDDCTSKITGEHRVSVAAWPASDGATRKEKERKPIVFRREGRGDDGRPRLGAPGGFERRFTLKNLVVNVLCDKHNPDLGEVDAASGTLTTAFRAFHDTWKHKRSNPLLRYDAEGFRVDGPLIERWMLKSAITNTICEGIPIGGFDAEPGTPTDELVDMAFGRIPVTGNVGLWGCGTVGANADEQDEFGFLPWHQSDEKAHTCVSACFVTYRGLRFLINLNSKMGFPSRFYTKTGPWKGGQFMRPFRGVDAPSANLDLKFEWPN